MRKILLPFVLLFLCFSASLLAQPAIQWDKTFGSPLNTASFSRPKNKIIEQTNDGGYIVVYLSNSRIAGDKSEISRGGSDFWIVKISATGTKEWDKTIGGPGAEYDPSIHQTSDGGYIVGGTSSSLAGGEKSENLRGALDYWIVKLDKNGNKVWDKTIGSTYDDYLVDVQQTADGNYILAGWSIGGIGGEKTEPSLGGDKDWYPSMFDYWIVKVSATGSIIWDKTLGTPYCDHMRCITQTSDGGFVLAGGDQQFEYGDSGYKLMKVSANGTKMWERIILGTDNAEIYDIEQTPDNGFILGGLSNQLAGGDQTEGSSGDYWIVKLNADLSIAWNNVLNTLFYDNGRGQNTFTDLTQTPDGGYAVLGYSSEPGLGDKSEDAHNESVDFWLVKLNASGTQVWDKVIGGAGSEFDGSITCTSDGGLIIAGRSSSDISFDKTENKKSNSDLWIVKLGPEYVLTTPTTIRINSGGPEFTTATKKTFVSDKYYSGIDRTSSIASGDILNTTNDVLYRSGRSAPSFSYNIPVINGQVNVTLHFAETYFGVAGTKGEKGGAGSRQFHVNMEGNRKLTNYDIFAQAGGAMRANQITIPVAVTDGVLNIDFLTGAADQPRVCAIEVVPVSVTLTPVADAYVRGGSYSATNLGLTGSLEVKSLSTDPAVRRASYLKFQLPAQTPVISAKLRVYGHNHENTKPISLHAYGVDTDSWTEAGITQSNAPAASTASLGFAGVTDVYKYYDIDVTSYVKAQQQAGEALVSLLLNDPNSRNTRLIFNSREAVSNPPQLVIQTANPGARFGQEEVLVETKKKHPSTVYPNPVKDQFTVSLSPEHAGQISFEMINASGQSRPISAIQNALPGENAEINIAGHSFNPGIYLLKIKSDAFTETVRILKSE